MTAKESNKTKKRKGRFFRRLFRSILVFVLLLAAAGTAYWFWPMSEYDIYDFVPEDACYIIESDDPIENWKSMSKTPMWRHLKKNDLMADIEGDANYLDTLIMDNEQIFSLVAGKKLLIVSQMYRADDYDFIYLMDLKRGAKAGIFLGLFRGMMSNAGYPMVDKELNGQSIYGIGEGKDEVLLAFMGNILIASYSETLMLKALKSSETPFYTRNGRFQAVRSRAYDEGNRESLAKMHVNFDQLDDMAAVYMDAIPATVISMSQTMDYASFDLKMKDDYAALVGSLNIDDSIPSLLRVMKNIKRGEIRCHNILPRYTSFLLSIDFHDFDYFYEQIALLMEEDDGFKEYEKTQDKVAGLLGVKREGKKVERKKRKGKDVDYFDWIGQEIAMAMIPVNQSGTKQSYVAMFHSPDRENAEHDLNEIEKKLKNRSPIRFDEYQYHGRSVKYLMLKGFFKLFLGKLFEKFDKPKYAILDDFVIFSNDTTALHRMIDVADGRLANLPMDAEYRKFYNHFEANSNYYLYVNMPKIFPFLPTMLDREAARDLRKNEQLLTRFRNVGLQLLSEDDHFEASLYIDFDKYEGE